MSSVLRTGKKILLQKLFCGKYSVEIAETLLHQRKLPTEQYLSMNLEPHIHKFTNSLG